MGFHDTHNFKGMYKKGICHGNLHYSLLRLLHESHRSNLFAFYLLIDDIRYLYEWENFVPTSSLLSIRHMVLKYKLSFTRFPSVLHWGLLTNTLCLFLHSLCGIIPGLSSIFLPRMNPFVLIDLAGAFALCITYMLIEIK